MAAFFSVLEKKTENSSGALAAGLTDRKQSRNKAQRRDFTPPSSCVSAPELSCCHRERDECSDLRFFQRGNIHYSPLPAAESVLTAFQVPGFYHSRGIQAGK